MIFECKGGTFIQRSIFYEQWNNVIKRPIAMNELQVNENLLLTTLNRSTYNDFDWSDFFAISFSHHIEILEFLQT